MTKRTRWPFFNFPRAASDSGESRYVAPWLVVDLRAGHPQQSGSPPPGRRRNSRSARTGAMVERTTSSASAWPWKRPSATPSSTATGWITSKKVAVVCKMAANRVWIKVTDEGTGFRPEHVPDPARPGQSRAAQRPGHHADALLHDPRRVQRSGQRRRDGKRARRFGRAGLTFRPLDGAGPASAGCDSCGDGRPVSTAGWRPGPAVGLRNSLIKLAAVAFFARAFGPPVR